MCCGRDTNEHEKKKEVGRARLTRRLLLKAVGVGTSLVALGGLTGCAQLLGIKGSIRQANRDVTTLGVREELSLAVDGKTLAVKPFSWRGRMHGFDLRFDSDKIKGSMNVRSVLRKGKGITYSRTRRDLFAIRFEVSPDQLPLIDEAARLITFNPLDLLDQEKAIQIYNRLEDEYPELIRALEVTIVWNNRQASLSLSRADFDKSTRKLAKLLDRAENSLLFPLGKNLHQFLVEHREFVVQAASMFPGAHGVDSQRMLIAQGMHDCIGCGLSIFGHIGGKYSAALACATGVGCALALALVAAATAGLFVSCPYCDPNSGDNPQNEGSPPPPPPPPDCDPTVELCPESRYEG